MNVLGDFFSLLFMNPTVNVLSAIYHLLVLLHIPSPLGFSFILLTVLIRGILYPFTLSQLRTQKKMQDIAPKIKKINELHKNDKQRLQQETMRLYKQHGVNPAAGCIPALIQLPIVIGLYQVLQNAVNVNPAHVVTFVNKAAYIPALRINHAWDPHFFGLPMAQAPSHLIATIGPLIVLIPLLTAAFQFIQSKMMIPVVKAEEVIEEEVQKEKGELTKAKQKEDDFQTALQTQSLYIFPIMIGFFSWTLPVGLSFYWNTFTIFGIIQQYQVQGWGGLSTLIKKIRK